jgi:tRNA threonylcarbamoyladenosine biosynthesis protein TsaE
MDMYRLSKRELATFPLEDYLGHGVCLIEWADRIRDRWPARTLELRLEYAGQTGRSLTVKR